MQWVVLLTLSAAVGTAAVSPGTGATTVHHPAPASAWQRSRCGAASSAGTDIITSWGQRISPDSVKTDFGYPRPQMTRPSWHSLNGLWEFQPMPWLSRGALPPDVPPNCNGARNCDGARPPFSQTLNQTVLVPFPVESCLSGLQNASRPGTPPSYQHMAYRTLVDGSQLLSEASGGQILLHFEAVDWQADVYVNALWVGSHEGGYDGFSFVISDEIAAGADSELDEIIVMVHDPSNSGSQPFGKQRTSALWAPAGDTYSPNSGIWQPVWIEVVPEHYVSQLRLAPNTTHLVLNVIPGGTTVLPNVSVTVYQHDIAVASAAGVPNSPFALEIPSPSLWSPESPVLYNMTVRYGSDTVGSYFGMRQLELGKDGRGVVRPCVNMQERFLTGVLDQSYWPDGIYTAPGDAALAADLESLKGFGMNYVRLHQKVNPQRWYYHADRLGIMVAQDVPQHYGDSTQGLGKRFQSNNGNTQARYYWHDLKALIQGRGSHPCIFMWDTFNEQDMGADFDMARVVEWVRRFDPSRMLDTDSGGPGNDLMVGDAFDMHVPQPTAHNSSRQFMMNGEWGNYEFWIDKHTWSDNRSEVCRLYGDGNAANAAPGSIAERIADGSRLALQNDQLSVMSYVQLTDTEMECDGIMSYDRTPKFNASEIQMIRGANRALVGRVSPCSALPPLPAQRAYRRPKASSEWPQWLFASNH